MIAGFTGSRQGMNDLQLERLTQYLENNKDQIKLAVHGGCVGSDEQFHNLCQSLEIPLRVRWGKPKTGTSRPFRAKLKGFFQEVKEEFYLARNKKIVGDATHLLGTPYHYDSKKGGTWHTINYATKMKVNTTIIFKDRTENRIY